jgi:hypothetical protein
MPKLMENNPSSSAFPVLKQAQGWTGSRSCLQTLTLLGTAEEVCVLPSW